MDIYLISSSDHNILFLSFSEGFPTLKDKERSDLQSFKRLMDIFNSPTTS